MTKFDARPGAMIGAFERIDAASKLKVDGKNRLVEPLPEIYWATMYEAHVLALLAAAPAHVGEMSGKYLVDQQERIAEARDRRDKILADKKAARGEPGPGRPLTVKEADAKADARADAHRRHPHRAAADAMKAAWAAADAMEAAAEAAAVKRPTLAEKIASGGFDAVFAMIEGVSVQTIADLRANRERRLKAGDRVRVTFSRRCCDGKFAGREGTVTYVLGVMPNPNEDRVRVAIDLAYVGAAADDVIVTADQLELLAR